uniref:DDE_Tnp_1_7 domain-containing protein n=1 Tax=Angiostrongylus cantonensis TaxID=6313 RepID=A0A0K0D8Z0_ANGCA
MVLRSECDYRTMNNDMLLYAITRIIPSVSRYSWNLDIDLSEEEASVVRNLPHFMVDWKDIDETLDVNMDESKSQCDGVFFFGYRY